MNFTQLQNSRIGRLIHSLELTIKKIQNDKNKKPLVMVLVGSYPDYSSHQDSPHHYPKYLDYILANYSDIFPIVIAIDPLYRKENIERDSSLDFLKYNPEKVISLIDNQDRFDEDHEANKVDKFIVTKNKRLVYRFLAWKIDDVEIDHLLYYLNLKTNWGIPSLLWSFTGRKMGDDRIMNPKFFHHPEGNCMADVAADLTYFPNLQLDSITGGYCFTGTEKSLVDLLHKYQITMTQFLTTDDEDKKSKTKLQVKINFYETNLYYLLKEFIKYYVGYRSWSNQMIKEGIIINRNSNDYEEKMSHLETRMRGFFYQNDLRIVFESSKFLKLEDFVNNAIFETSSLCLEFLSIIDSNFNYIDQLQELINGSVDPFDEYIKKIMKLLEEKYPKLTGCYFR